MSEYLVTVRVFVYEDDVVRAKDAESLRQLKEEGGDYLADYVAAELEWAAHSFSRLDVEQVKQIEDFPDYDEGVMDSANEDGA